MDTLFLTNARFYTFNSALPTVERLVIEGGKITAAGSAREISSDSFPGSKVTNLGGMTVLPAFTDAHIHLLEYGLSLRRVACETATKTECIRRVCERVRETPSGKWVLGHGWNHNIWPDGAPDKKDLDSYSPENPVYLTHKSLHSAWSNSAALNAVGITRTTPDPQGGIIGRSPDGEPNGILNEGAMRLVENAIPRPNAIENEVSLSAAQAELHRFGIATVHDFDGWDCYESLAKLDAERKLKLRVVKNIPFPNLGQAIETGIKSGDGSEMLSFGWLKLFADGALGPQTAAMLAPYEGSNSTGMLLLNSEDIIETGQKAMSAGISLAIHAIGDRANREVLNGYAQLFENQLFGKTTLKPRIEHVQLIAPEDTPRLARLGVTASMQPIHAVSDRDIADRYWGNRCGNAYAWSSVLQTGAKLIFGSDAPVESPNPFWGLFAAVSRSSLGNEAPRAAWTPHQRISLNDALNAFITQPHLATRPGQKSGRLQAGYSADLVVLPNDLFTISMDEIASILPVATMVNGEWVYMPSLGIQ
ncbi:MAG: amidohydrolase [Pelolinea sp.]|nr:amidohydrolase [Pelolinea sp.]